jgi:hypothetical protein
MAMYSFAHGLAIPTCRLDRLVSVCSGALDNVSCYDLGCACIFQCLKYNLIIHGLKALIQPNIHLY